MASDGRRRIRFDHQAVSSGVRIAVTITDAATCTVAAGAIAAYDGSASAIACGTAAELPAVLDACVTALDQFGTKSLAEVIQPAIELADGFPIDELRKFEFRGEMFNLPNHPNF